MREENQESTSATALEGYLKAVLKIGEVFKKHAEKGKQDMRTEAQSSA